ncbi:MAG: mechanosensitive ion channel family protein [Paracoccaceae bacterium]
MHAQVALTGSSSSAAPAPELPDPLTPEAVREVVAHMSDDQVRDLLLDRLDAVAAEQAAQLNAQSSKSLIDRVSETWTAFYSPLIEAVRRLPLLVTEQIRAVGNFAAKLGGGGLLLLAVAIIGWLGIGYLAELLVNRITRAWHHVDVKPGEGSLRSSMSFLSRRFCAEIMGLFVFFFVARTVALATVHAMPETFTQDKLEFVRPFFTYLIWFPRLGAAFSRLILAPSRSDLRLVNVDDHWAKFLHKHIIGLVVLAGFGIFIVLFNVQNDVPMGETRIGFWLNGFVHLYVAWIAWQARDGLISMMRGTDPDNTPYDERMAEFYPKFVIIISALTWIMVSIIAGYGNFKLLLGAPHYATMFWLLMAPAADTLIRGIVRHTLPPMIGEGPVAEAAYRSTKRSYIRIGRVIAIAFVVLMIANAWNFDLGNLSKVGGEGSFAAHMIGFTMTGAVGYIAYEAVSLYVNRRLAKEQTSLATTEDEMAAGEGGGAGGSRLATVLPLVLLTAQVAIVVIFGLLAVGNLGIDITPLLAGAGILGLAIGFGAQKLVTDVVSGIFFLVDDAFRVGEYVEVGGTMGTVEKISIRSMQLRHHRGLVHTIPYGEIPKLTNFSRDWVIMKLKFTVPFDTDPNKVKKIFKKIGAAMMEDPLYKDAFIEPFKSQGVFDFDDVGMIIRGKFMAKPGQQFTLRKEIYNRVKVAFKENDIDFARREVRVAIPGLDDAENLSKTDKAQISAAAGEAVQQQIRDAEEAEQNKK